MSSVSRPLSCEAVVREGAVCYKGHRGKSSPVYEALLELQFVGYCAIRLK